VPTGLVLDTFVETVAGVDQRVKVTATWAASTADDFAYYEIQIKQDTGNYVGFQTGTNYQEWSVPPTKLFTVKVRAVDAFGNASNYCTAATITSYDSPSLADLINEGSTTIDAGHISIFGPITLADWRRGGDETHIDGGVISANTIETNSLTVGNRNVKWEGLQFEHNSPTANKVAWTSGVISYVGDDGNYAQRTVAASNATWSTGTLYLYWVKGAIVISSTTVIATAMDPNNVVLAAYKGNTDLVTDYGRTVIDGSNVKTGTIDTQQIKANAITAGLIAAGAINAGHLQANSVTTAALAAGSVTADKLTVGTGGNLLENTDHAAGITGYNMTGIVADYDALRVRTPDTWTPTTGAIELHQSTATSASYADLNHVNASGLLRYFSCFAGQRFELSAYVAAHRCQVQMFIEWIDSAGAIITYTGTGTQTVLQSGSWSMANYSRLLLFGTAPANAVRFRPFFRKLGTLAGQTDSYSWWTHMYLGEASANQTQPTPWSVGGVTQIGPGNITTNSLSALSANLGNVTAGQMQSPDGKVVFSLTGKYLKFSE
jgi:hypothetical protein